VLIRSVAFRTPSRRVTNDDLLNDIRAFNDGRRSAEEIDGYCLKIGKLLLKAGAGTRFVRDRACGEKGFDLLLEAVRAALSDAALTAADVDLIIYCGVGRGFLEPANAIFVAKALGINCDAFDVLDACMGWVRAAHIAYNFLRNGTYRNILVVNAEFTAYEHGLPDVLRILSNEELDYTFPALTIGEATTATVLTASPHAWKFRFRSASEFAPLCTVPLPGFGDFCEADERLGLNGPHRLVSFGAQLSRAAVQAMVAFIDSMYEDTSSIDVWFPHAMAGPILADTANSLGVGNRLYSGVFGRFGNIISASIPAGMSLCAREGRLRRDDTFVLCPATAGMAFALVESAY